MIDRKNMKWLLVGVIVLVFLGGQDTLPKEAVADVNGQACTLDEDCPCWGTIEESGVEAFGIGVSTCTESFVCDTTYCFDVQPVGEWARDHPWQWLKDNPLITAAIVGLLVMLAFWPKQ